MSHQLFTPIEEIATDRLAQLFNAYFFQLSSFASVTVPRASMQQAQDLLRTHNAYQAQAARAVCAQLYQLQVLATALPDLYGHLRAAHLELWRWAEQHGQNFQHYAAARGAEEASLSADERRIMLKDGPEALLPFQLAKQLVPHFASASLGERIGSSGPEAYYHLSHLVDTETRYAIRNPLRSAIAGNVRVYSQSKAGKLGLPADQPDNRFSEAAQSLSGMEVVKQFEAVLLLCQEAATLYASLVDDDAAGYQRLHELVGRLVEGNWEISTGHEVIST